MLIAENQQEAKRQAIEQRKANGNEWPPGQIATWESFSQIRTRVLSVLDWYSNGGKTLVVCHHTVIEALTGRRPGHAELVPYEVQQLAPEGSLPANKRPEQFV